MGGHATRSTQKAGYQDEIHWQQMYGARVGCTSCIPVSTAGSLWDSPGSLRRCLDSLSASGALTWVRTWTASTAVQSLLQEWCQQEDRSTPNNFMQSLNLAHAQIHQCFRKMREHGLGTGGAAESGLAEVAHNDPSRLEKSMASEGGSSRPCRRRPPNNNMRRPYGRQALVAETRKSKRQRSWPSNFPTAPESRASAPKRATIFLTATSSIHEAFAAQTQSSGCLHNATLLRAKRAHNDCRPKTPRTGRNARARASLGGWRRMAAECSEVGHTRQ